MRISVRVKVNSKIEAVEKGEDNNFTVRVKAPAIEGRANDAVVKTLAEYFEIPKSRISVIKGLKSKIKLVEIL